MTAPATIPTGISRARPIPIKAIPSIFAGAVHDYFSGMLSLRHGGASIPEVVGQHLGGGFRQFMRAFSVVLLLLVGVVFILGPAKILTGLTGEFMSLGSFGTFDLLLLVIFLTIWSQQFCRLIRSLAGYTHCLGRRS